MDNSTENVTLWAAFIGDVLKGVENEKQDSTTLRAIAKDYDLSNPYALVPMQIYNDMCFWVEKNLGEESIVRIGFAIGDTAYAGLADNGLIDENSTPKEIMENLIIAAASMIQDPKERGWEIVTGSANSLQMKRTQTFNSRLQLGLLKGLISKSKVKNVGVDYVKSVEKGDEFDEYLITWEN